MSVSAEQKELLQLARDALTHFFRTGERSPPSASPLPLLDEKRGVFVTLHKQGELRGCIGRLVSEAPLRQAIPDLAIAAATEDFRFPPVTAEELEEIQIEISLVSPLREIAKLEEIRVGEHGLYLIRGGHRGVLLPQVPVAHGWDLPTFLSQTCLKAGLPPEAWQREKLNWFVFTAELFSEGEG